jgi:hypothetical protein
MTKLINIKREVNEINERITDIYRILDIYNINDLDSIKSIREELKIYKDKLKKITDEELK